METRHLDRQIGLHLHVACVGKSQVREDVPTAHGVISTHPSPSFRSRSRWACNSSACFRRCSIVSGPTEASRSPAYSSSGTHGGRRPRHRVHRADGVAVVIIRDLHHPRALEAVAVAVAVAARHLSGGTGCPARRHLHLRAAVPSRAAAAARGAGLAVGVGIGPANRRMADPAMREYVQACGLRLKPHGTHGTRARYLGSTLTTVIIPAISPFGPVTWSRMWQWKAQTPRLLAVKAMS